MVSMFGGGYGMSRYSSVALGGSVGGLIGGLQTALLREYADSPLATNFLKNTSGTPPVLMAQLKGFGSVSALAGIIGGTIGLIIGALGVFKRKVIRNMTFASAMFGYGLSALFTGVLSGALPTVQWGAATAADPNNPIGAPAVQRNALQVMRQSAPVNTLGA